MEEGQNTTGHISIEMEISQISIASGVKHCNADWSLAGNFSCGKRGERGEARLGPGRAPSATASAASGGLDPPRGRVSNDNNNLRSLGNRKE